MAERAFLVLFFSSLLIALPVAVAISQLHGETQDAGSGLPRDNPLKNETTHAVTVEASQYPLKLTMTVEKTKLEPSETLYVNFTLENIGDQDLIMSFGDGCEHFWFVIYNDSDSQRVYTHFVAYPQMRISEVMHPHETRVQEWAWRQVGDLVYLGLDKDPPYYFKTIVPGTYYIVGMFKSGTLNLPIQTPSVSFTIRKWPE